MAGGQDSRWLPTCQWRLQRQALARPWHQPIQRIMGTCATPCYRDCSNLPVKWQSTNSDDLWWKKTIKTPSKKIDENDNGNFEIIGRYGRCCFAIVVLQSRDPPRRPWPNQLQNKSLRQTAYGGPNFGKCRRPVAPLARKGHYKVKEHELIDWNLMNICQLMRLGDLLAN